LPCCAAPLFASDLSPNIAARFAGSVLPYISPDPITAERQAKVAEQQPDAEAAHGQG
jgi:hypothetical protein